MRENPDKLRERSAVPVTLVILIVRCDGLVLQAALRGQGVALLDKVFADEEIRAGRLRQLFDLTVPKGAC